MVVLNLCSVHQNRRTPENKCGQTEREGGHLRPSSQEGSTEGSGRSWGCQSGVVRLGKGGTEQRVGPGTKFLRNWEPSHPGSASPLVGGPRNWAQRAQLHGCVAEKNYAQLVFMSTSAGSLWNLHAIHSMCRMEQDQVRQPGGGLGHRNLILLEMS